MDFCDRLVCVLARPCAESLATVHSCVCVFLHRENSGNFFDIQKNEIRVMTRSTTMTTSTMTPTTRMMTPPPTMVRYLVELASGNDTIWVATDGGSDYPSVNGTEAGKIRDEALRRASWSVVVKAGQREPQKWGGVLSGFDRTA